MGTHTTRILSLDVLRGIAILGTLGTNIWIFTHPQGFLGYLIHGGVGAGGALGAIEAVLQQIPQGKFLGLLTIMFGIGLAIQRESALRANRAWPGAYPWRAALLFLDGVLHYLLVVEFDILMGYAVTGVVVAYLLATSERSQRAWMWAAAIVHLVLLVLLSLALLAMGGEAQDQAMAFNPYADGSWWQLVELRLRYVVLFRLEPVFVFFLSVALFLAGAGLYARGVLDARGTALRRRLMAVGLGVALPLDFLIGLAGGDAGLVFARYGTAPFVALGLLALVAEFYARRQRIGAAGRRLAEVGRIALSGYVLQNILASTLCYGWGLGLAARLTPDARVPATVALYLLVGGSVALFAHLWLRRFERGPLEWLWHASYRRLARIGRD